AHFGIVTPVLSVVVSTFMLGLGIGSLAAGRWGEALARRLRLSSAVLYGAAEMIIGIGALVVPALFERGEMLLLGLSQPSSAEYLLLSGLVIAGSLLPWCTMMGTTYPLMMAFMRRTLPEHRRSFSHLYLANVAGAMTGTLASAGILIELLGFRQTSLLAALVNFAIAATAFALSRRRAIPASVAKAEVRVSDRSARFQLELVLFTTGFCSLAMEVVWARAFTVVLQTTIYAFAAILSAYLFATWLGSAFYRRSAAQGRLPADELVLFWTAIFAVLPVLLDDPRLHPGPATVLLSIMPFSAVLGFLTPKLVDDHASGEPAGAGRAYAVNIAGGIVGPLFAGYALVPIFDVGLCEALLAIPLVALALWALARSARPPRAVAVRAVLAVVPLGVGLTISRSYESVLFADQSHQVHRDYVATAIAYGTGRDKQLVVNGVGITAMTPITKIIAHLPLAEHPHPTTGLVICFGMGTTFRSMASWGIDTTAVDLTGSVIRSFGFFHTDAEEITADPRNHLVVDDGRRFLLRTDRSFDVIVIDPPPPVEAAGSSLLYSDEFYEAAKRHLRSGGILQQWFPIGEDSIAQAVARSLGHEFPYVVVYRSIEDWGYHFLASMQPIPDLTPSEFVARLPDKARADLVEWGPEPTAEKMAERILQRRIPLADLARPDRLGPAITDDRPYNEYFILRRLF
ncbi:MAG TPA: hypothetical protein VKS60_22465, partial [Stellaceae bacterium]|nr:hypothetical protein [Stellaceae bacterium]